jgi:beta-glucanase (GH16 family)
MAKRVALALILVLAIQVASPLQGNGQPSSKQRLIWSDDFEGPAGARPDPSKWNYDLGGNGWQNNELQTYTSEPANASLDGRGDLVIAARAEPHTGDDGIARNYTSARLQTWNAFQFKYGLVEARIKAPAGAGLLAAFWSLDSNAYRRADSCPKCGEMDTVEVEGANPRVVYGTLHGPWPWAPGGIQGSKRAPKSLAAGFNTYGLQWSPHQITFLFDGKPYKTFTPADLHRGSVWPFRHPSFLLLNVAVGGKWAGPPKASTKFPAQMLVDWVRVWK